MKKMRLATVVSAAAAVLAVLAILGGTFVSCDTGGGDGPQKVTITGTDTDGSVYSLAITGKEYELFINNVSVSTGIATAYKQGDKDGYILTPNGGDNAPTFVVYYNFRNQITSTQGAITGDSGAIIQFGEFISSVTEAGVWEWAHNDDQTPNEKRTLTLTVPPYLGTFTGNPSTAGAPFPANGQETFVQTIYEGGASAIEMTEIETPANMSGEFFRISGVTKVSSPNRPINQGAQFPSVGWEAIPADEDTLEKFKTAYGFSFYIKVNAAKQNNTENQWAFKAAVSTNFAEEQGHEFKLYFGNYKPDAAYNSAAIKNWMGNLPMREWRKIIVVMDKNDDGFNIDQDMHIHVYNNRFLGGFDQSQATKIQWQIGLQDNGGSQRNGDNFEGDPYYDMITGEFTYDLEFGGLELLMP